MMKLKGIRKKALWFLCFIFVFQTAGIAIGKANPVIAAVEGLQAESSTAGSERAPAQAPALYVEGEVIVKYKSHVRASQQSSVRQLFGLIEQERLPLAGAELVKLAPGEQVEETVQELRASGLVEYAQPNYLYYADTLPSDAGQNWGLHNEGQLIETASGFTGAAGIDIGAKQGWAYAKQDAMKEVIVAVIDTGVDLSHPDLREFIWTNPDEVADGTDTDGNGYIDDIHGWDFYHDDASVFDDYIHDTHGTHVAGIIAAGIGNGGAAGAATNVKIMPLKFINGDEGGSTLDAIRAIEYASDQGALVANNSWSSAAGAEDAALRDAIDKAQLVFVSAAGNGDANGNGIDTDKTPVSPASLETWNQVAVASLNANGELSTFSNYGARTVHVGAPGEDIYSTIPVIDSSYTGVQDPNAYEYASGTSMAAPFVSAVAAMILGQKEVTVPEAIALLKESGAALDSLAGKTSTGKMVSLEHALGTSVSSPSVTVGNSTEWEASAYEITFVTSAYGALADDKIYLNLQDVDFTSIPASAVSVNGAALSDPEQISVNGKIVTITTPVLVGHSSPVTIRFSASAGLVNRDEGSHRIEVWTSNDALPVASNAFVIGKNTTAAAIRYTGIDYTSFMYGGTVSEVVYGKLQQGAFTGTDGDKYGSDKVLVSGLPNGLSASVTKEDNLTVSISVYGSYVPDYNDTAYAAFQMELLDSAFDGGSASAIRGAKHTVTIVPNQTLPSLRYANSRFVESDRNDGSMSTISTVFLSDGAFAGAAGEAMNASQVVFGNVPAGLTPKVTKRSDHIAVISLSGKASSHAVADSMEAMTVEFRDAAFQSVPAEWVRQAVKTDLALEFKDSPVIETPSIEQNGAIVRLTWNAVPGADGYVVLRAGAGQDFEPLGQRMARGESTFTYEDELFGFLERTYRYKVVVVKGKMVSESDEAAVTLQSPNTLFIGVLDMGDARLNGTQVTVRKIGGGGSFAASYDQTNPGDVEVDFYGIAPYENDLLYFFRIPNGAYELTAVSGNREGIAAIETQTSELLVLGDELYFYTEPENVVLQAKSTGGGGGGGGGFFLPPVSEETSETQPQQGDSGQVTLRATASNVMRGGVEVAVATVTAEQWRDAVNESGDSGANRTIVIEVAAEGAVDVQLPLKEVSDTEGVSTVVIQSNNASYHLQLSILNPAELAQRLGAAADQILLSVRIEQASDDARQEIDRAANATGAQVLGEPIEFRVLAAAGGRTVEINSFGRTYVERTITIDAVVGARATAALYDPIGGMLTFVPATFTRQGGKTIATIKRNGNSTYVLLQSQRSFSDTAGHWAQADIELLASKLLLNGTSAHEFSPGANVTRAEFAAMIARSLALTGGASAAGFADVADGAWYAAAVKAAAAAGIVTGYEDGTFRPHEFVTREQVAVMFARAMDYVGRKPAGVNAAAARFTDGNTISAWAGKAVAEASAANIVGGNPDGSFDPAGPATRAQAAAMLKRMLAYVDFIN